MQNNIVIAIPTKRPGRILTLESYATNFPVIIVSSPATFEGHQEIYRAHAGCEVVLGTDGMGAQSARCYEEAWKRQFPLFFRMDDDLSPNTFVGKEPGSYPMLDYCIWAALRCMKETGTSLAGFANTTNRYWMHDKMSRTYGLVHGGANLARSAEDGSKYCDPTLVRGEDVYRTCAHREEREGYVGRVGNIGFDKKQSTVTAMQSSIVATPEQVQASRDLILNRFPDMVTCNGTRFINNGKDEIANWRFRRS